MTEALQSADCGASFFLCCAIAPFVVSIIHPRSSGISFQSTTNIIIMSKKELVEQVKAWLDNPDSTAAAGRELLLNKEMSTRQHNVGKRCRHLNQSSARLIESELKRWYRINKDEADNQAQTIALEESAALTATATGKKEEPASAPKPVVADKPVIVPPVEKVFSAKEYEELPQDIKDFIAQGTDMQRKRSAMMAKLDDESLTDDQRREVAEFIVEATEHIDNCYAAQRFYKEHGHLPKSKQEEVAEDNPKTLADVLKELNNARSRRSRARTAATKAKGKKNEKEANEKLAALEAEVQELENLKAKLEGDAAVQHTDN